MPICQVYLKPNEALKMTIYRLGRGVELDLDDVIRRHIIVELMCHSELDYSTVNEAYSIDFIDYFKQELKDLTPFTDDDLIKVTDKGLHITPSGRMLMRNIGMQFDAYLKPGGKTGNVGTYSRLI